MTPFPHRRLVDTSTGRVAHLSNHARERMAQMQADPADVLRTALEPHSTYEGNDNSGRTRLHRRDDSKIAVVFARAASLVITIVPQTDETYTRETT